MYQVGGSSNIYGGLKLTSLLKVLDFARVGKVAVSFMLGKAAASKRLKLHGSEPVRRVAAETQREIALPFGRDPVR